MGGPDGNTFDDVTGPNGIGMNNAYFTTITSLQVNHGDTLDHLIVSYQVKGEPFGPIPHGRSGGGQQLAPFLIGDREKLVKVEGWLHVFSGTQELNGLRFTKREPDGRLRDSGVLGSWGGNDPFMYDISYIPDAEIIAFYGRQGLFVNALGVWIRTPTPVPDLVAGLAGIRPPPR